MMTFLAEWGDRSQIATIAMAATYVSAQILPEPMLSTGKLLILWILSLIPGCCRCHGGWSFGSCALHWSGCHRRTNDSSADIS